MGEVNVSAKVFESHLDPILGIAYGVALRLTHNPTDAEDLVQEASVKSFCGFHTFESGTNFKAWFLKILTNSFYEQYRKKQRTPDMVELEEDTALFLYNKTYESGLHNGNENPGEIFLSKVNVEQITTAIAELPVDYRVVAALYFMDEFSYREIADIIDCPVGTVRSRLHRSRRILQKSLWKVAEEQGIVDKTADAKGTGK